MTSNLSSINPQKAKKTTLFTRRRPNTSKGEKEAHQKQVRMKQAQTRKKANKHKTKPTNKKNNIARQNQDHVSFAIWFVPMM